MAHPVAVPIDRPVGVPVPVDVPVGVDTPIGVPVSRPVAVPVDHPIGGKFIQCSPIWYQIFAFYSPS